MAEIDPKYEEFRRKWQARLRLNDRQAAESFMRGEAIDAAEHPPLPDDRAKVGLHLRVDGRGIDGQADPGAIPDMIAEWQAVLDDVEPRNPREFTKDVIEQVVGRNWHLEEEGALIMSGVVWLASNNPQVVKAFRGGNCALTCTYTYDDEKRVRRVILELGFGD